MPLSDGDPEANSGAVPTSECPPVVLVCYNRVDRVREVLDALRAVRPSTVLVVADGPRADDSEDLDRCNQVRSAIAAEIDWPCRVERQFADTNHGVEQTVELGLDWAFGLVEEAIVLEDDCVPDPTFFSYVRELLDRYALDERMMMISGTRFAMDDEIFAGHSYVFSTFSITWGWATWRRAWQRHRAIFPRDYTGSRGAVPQRVGSTHYSVGALQTRGGHRYFNEVGRARHHEFGWDSQWFRSQAILGTLAIAPVVNMVHNAGFGEDATHTVSSRRMPAAEPITFPLSHPTEVTLNVAAERSLELGMVRTNGRLARTLRRVVPHGRLRTWSRHVAERVIRHR